MLTISPEKLYIKFKNEQHHDLGNNRFIVGEIWGYHNPFKEKTLHKEDVLNLFATTPNTEIENVLLHSIGNFYYLEKTSTEIIIKTCPSFLDGLFYIKQDNLLLFSTCEKGLHKQALSLSLEEDLLFNEFYGEPISILSNKTLFKEIEKIPAGSTVKIDPDGTITQNFYVFEKYKNFKEASLSNPTYRKKIHIAIEKTVDAIASANKKRAIFLLLSDGIDSTSIFLALLKLNIPFTAVNITDFTPLIGMIEKLKEIAKDNPNVTFLDLRIADLEADISQQDICLAAQKHFRLRGIISPIYAPIHYFKTNKVKHPVLLMGGGFDIIYHGRKTGSSIEIGTSFYYAHLKYFFKRFYRHYSYLNLFASNRFSKLFKIVKNKEIPYDPVHYTASFVAGPDALDDGFFPFTMPSKGQKFSDKLFKKIFYDVRKRETVDQISSYIHDPNTPWSAERINFFNRTALTYSHFGLPNPFHDPSDAHSCTIIDVGYQPSIFNLFLKAKVDSYKDLFKIKRAIFQFANSHFKKYNCTYEKIARTCKKSDCGLEYNFFKMITKPIVSRINKANVLLRSFLKKILPHKIVLRLKKKDVPKKQVIHQQTDVPFLEAQNALNKLYPLICSKRLKDLFPQEAEKNLPPIAYFSLYLSKNNLISKIKEKSE